MIQRLTGHPARRLNYSLIGMLVIVSGAIALGLVLVLVSPLGIAVGVIGCLGAIIWLASLQSGRDFERLFLVLFFIGYFQGFLSIRLGDSVPQTVWGLSKYGILGMMVIGCTLRLADGKRTALSKRMLLWLGVWAVNWVMLALFMIEAMNVSKFYSPILTIQIFGIGNMAVGILTYLRARPQSVQMALRLLVWTGVVAAIWGVIQRLIGPSALASLGFQVSGGFFFLSANMPETGFLDVVGGLRAFSFFDTHHAFSAFLILSVMALQILRTQRRIGRWAYLISMVIIWSGFAVTFNLTNALTAVIALVFFALLEQSKRKSISRVLLNKRLWRSALSVAVFSAVIVFTIVPIRNRILGAFEVSKSASTAGGSLAYRLEGFVAGLQAIVDYPLGFGLWLSPLSLSGATIDPFGEYARVNGYFASKQVFFSGDNWFQWLMVQVGLPGFALYSLLFIIPIYVGWKQRKRILNPEISALSNGLLALMIATFIAGVSNSPILAFAPSNLLIWGVAGVLMKLSSWDIDLRRGVEYAR